MPIVKLDQKMRIRLPKKVSKELGLKDKEPLEINVKDGRIEINKLHKTDLENDPVLRDMIERPMHSKIRVTTELLNKMAEEQWIS